jgi:hypothetical protein
VNVAEPKIVGSVAARGERAAMCRMVFGQDAVEFAIVDIHSWTINECGTYIPNVFDAELGEVVTLEYELMAYGGLSAASVILETKATILSGADMDALEVIVRRRQARFEKRRDSPALKLYHEKVKTMYEQYATRNPGASNVSNLEA